MGIQKFHVCYHCQDREVGCHSTCDRYKKESEQRQDANNKANEQKGINRTLVSLGNNRVNKRIRHDSWGR